MEFENRVYLWILESNTVQKKHHFSMWPVKYLAQELCSDLDGVYLVPFAIYSAFEVRKNQLVCLCHATPSNGTNHVCDYRNSSTPQL